MGGGGRDCPPPTSRFDNSFSKIPLIAGPYSLSPSAAAAAVARGRRGKIQDLHTTIHAKCESLYPPPFILVMQLIDYCGICHTFSEKKGKA